MTPASRNVWLEITALGLFLLSLVPFLVASYFAAMLVVTTLVPGKLQMKAKGVAVGRNEALIPVTSMAVLGGALIGTACRLRFLLVDEEEPQE
jgi:membrane protein DedA with SNARE-associated domain